MENNKTQSYVKNVSGTEPFIVGFLYYAFSRSELSFYVFMLLVAFSIMDLSIELFLFIKKNKTLKGALTIYKWICLALCLTLFLVGIFAPAEVLYK